VIQQPRKLTDISGQQQRRLLAYVADLELEVDRLRRQHHLVHKEMRSALDQIQKLCAAPAADGAPSGPAPAAAAVTEALATLHDLRDPPGYHPAHDQVVAIAVRPLVEQTFIWQQRLQKVPDVTLRFALEAEHVDWFPARLRHIVDQLLANALRNRDSQKGDMWIEFGLRATPTAYELWILDNGIGLNSTERDQVFDLFFRAAPVRDSVPGVGMAVVQLLVEQSGGSLTVDSGAGRGTKFFVVLPRYEMDDYLA
jgi:signal transduction histidine kinase